MVDDKQPSTNWSEIGDVPVDVPLTHSSVDECVGRTSDGKKKNSRRPARRVLHGADQVEAIQESGCSSVAFSSSTTIRRGGSAAVKYHSLRA